MSYKKKNTFTFAMLAWISSLGPASAAALSLPSTAEPSRVQGRIAPPVLQARPEASVTSPAAQAEQAPPGADKIEFMLNSLVIEGVTVYDVKEISSFYKDLVGRKIKLTQVYELANALTARYRNDGYILSQVIVPPQTIDGGALKLQAVEGFIDHITIQSKRLGDASFFMPYVEHIKASKPLNEKILEKYLLLLNDMPGIQAKSILSPSQSTPGASELTLTIDHKDVDASLETDNRGSRFMGPGQVNASSRLNDTLGYGEGITIQAATSVGTMKYGSGSVSLPVGHLGSMLTFSGGISATTPGYTLAQFEIKGLSHTYSIGATHPFIRSRNENLTGSAKFDYLDTTRSDNLGDPLIEDRIRVIRIGMNYQRTDRFQGGNAVATEISKGINIFHTKLKGSPDMTRAEGDPLFFKATAEVSRTQRITDMFDAYAAVTGQWAPNPLLASEEFSVGGTAYGSAYDSSEITGQNGMAFRAELRANNPVWSRLQQLQPYIFYDIGKVWEPTAPAAQDRINSLASAGLGIRAAFNDNFSGSAEWGQPLTRKLGTTNDKGSRLFGMIAAKF